MIYCVGMVMDAQYIVSLLVLANNHLKYDISTHIKMTHDIQ